MILNEGYTYAVKKYGQQIADHMYRAGIPKSFIDTACRFNVEEGWTSMFYGIIGVIRYIIPYLITKIRKIRRIRKRERTYHDRLLILQPLDRNPDVDGDLHHLSHGGITLVAALEIERRSHMEGAGIPLRFGRFQDLLHRRIIGRNNL